jgi:hypothetical protein
MVTRLGVPVRFVTAVPDHGCRKGSTLANGAAFIATATAALTV